MNIPRAHERIPDDIYPQMHPRDAVGSMTFYQFSKILTGSIAAFSVVVALLFTLLHATHFSKPNEQFK